MKDISKDEISKSLDVLGEYLPDIKNAVLNSYYSIDTKRLDNIKEIKRCIKIYSIFNDIQDLTGRKIEVLSYYLLYGFNKDTKKDIIENINITANNLNNINHELRKLGFIRRSGYNKRNNEVNPDLLDFKKFIVDNKKSYILININ